MYEKLLKQAADYTVAFILLILTLPLSILITVFLWVYFGKPPFFTQLRTGKNEKAFLIIKFQTMNEKRDETGRLLPDNDRTPMPGYFMRRTGLDELPQLLNILKGEMSFVGPRPWLPEYLPYFSQEVRKRHAVKPGVTGLAQINGGNSLEWEKRFELDLQYVQKISLKGDLKILVATLKAIFKKDLKENIGSYKQTRKR